MNLKKYSGKMYCFSPPVMLFTFLFEFAAVFYILWRYKMSTLVRLVTAMLLSLGTFQLAEYMICGGLGINGIEWARLGYISITLLPIIGLHIIATLAGKKVPWLIYPAYASMVAFGLYYALVPGAVNAQECRPNYAVFNLTETNALIYSAYYYGWLLVGTGLSLYWARTSPAAKALHWLCAGYLVFMIPTITINLINPATIAGIPSIMCGFAVILAFVLVAFVMPASKNPLRVKARQKALKKPA